MPEALKDLKVLDLSMNLPGPYMTWLLACLGAEVVKVENPEGGDYARGLGGAKSGAGSPYFHAINRNKKSVTLNLKHPEARRLFLALLGTYDVIVDGFRPGTMDRLGLGFDVTSARQERLIHVSISGYGQEGPNRLRAGHDVNYLALAGVIGMTGTREGQLALPGVQIADLAGGSLMGLCGLLVAVIQREKTGRGQFVDVSMFHGSLSLATMIFGGIQAGLEEPFPGKMVLNGRFPCYGLFRTKDDRYMSLGALEFKFWQNFCDAVGRPELVGLQYGQPEVIQEIENIFAGRTQQEWVELMKNHDACCEPVLTLTQAAQSDLAAARNMITSESDEQRFLGFPLRLSASDPSANLSAPKLGEHTYEVLSQLGLTTKELDALSDQGVI